MSDLILDDFYEMQEINAQSAKINLAPLLEKEEELLWSSQPKQGLFWQAWEPPMIFNGLLWMSAPLTILFYTMPFFLAGNWPTPTMLMVMPVLLLVFVLGWYTSIGQYLTQAKQRKTSFYGLTSTALLVMDAQTTERIPLKKVLTPQIQPKSKKFGHLQFKFPMHQVPGTQQTFAKGINLRWIPNVERLEDLLHKAQQENLLP
ncbi:MAG: hypothetical protein ACRBFS_00360 [Aureispira sp.]